MQLDWQDLIDKTVQDESLRESYLWEPFAGGSSNSIFLGRLKQGYDSNVDSGIFTADQSKPATASTETVVLRINAPAKNTPGVSRKREAAILDWIKPYNWAPQIIRNEPEQGWCLMHYYEDAVKARTELAEALPGKFHDLILNAVDELHAVDVSLDLNSKLNLTTSPRRNKTYAHDLSVSSKNNLRVNYETLLNEAYLGIAKAKNDTQALEWIESIKNDIAALPELPQCVVHHDLHRGNLVISASKKADQYLLTILDWEYASIGSPWFDASCLSRYLSIPADKIHQLRHFNSFDKMTFESGLQQANEMTKTLQDLWHRTRHQL